MKSLLVQDQEKRNQQHHELVNSFDMLKNTVTGLQLSIDTERTTRQNEVEMIKGRLNTIEQKEQKERTDVEDIVKTEVRKALNTVSKPPGGQGDEDEERSRQVIAKGFDYDTEQEQIVATLEDFLKVGTRRQKVTDVGTFTDPASIGVITFSSIAAKVGFYKKIRNHGTKLGNDRQLRFENNDKFEVRTRNQALIQIKYQLHHKLDHPVADIIIDRAKGLVKIKKVLAATVTEDSKIKFEDSIVQVQTDVEQHMTDWIAKRTRE